MDKPQYWNDLQDILIPIYGKSFQSYRSFSIFFEYFGLKRLLNNPALVPLIFKRIEDIQVASKNATNLASIIDIHFYNAREDIHRQLLLTDTKSCLTEKINKRKEFESSFLGSSELWNNLFSPYLDDISKDYPKFCEYASLYLAWDYFCSITPAGIKIEIFRQFQLRLWINFFHKDKIILPLGKLCDDFRFKNLEMQAFYKASLQGNNKAIIQDMVDSEAITAIFFEKVVFLAYDEPSKIRQRIDSMLEIIKEIQKILNITLPTNFGNVYCLSRSPIKIIDEIYPVVPIEMGQINSTEILDH